MELHPLCTLFPRITGAEFEALKDDIKANGLRQPIVVLDGMILDGGNRYRACVESGVEPTTVEFTGGNLVSFVLSANLHRRHLTPGQQAAIVASAQDWAQAQSRGGDRGNQHGGPSQTATLPLASVADRAAQSGASERTQRMADKVAREAPDLAKKVAHGEITLPKAVEQITPKKEEPETAAADEQADFDNYVAMLQRDNESMLRELESLRQSDRDGEIQKLTQLLLNAEAKITSFEEKAKALRWFGEKFSEMRKILNVKHDRDVVRRVREIAQEMAA